MGRISKLRLAGLLLTVTLLGGACDHRSQATQTDQASATTATITATPTTLTLDKPCLHDVRSAKPFWFQTAAGAMLVGVVLGRGRTGLVLAHGRGGDLCEWLPRAQGFAKQGYQALAFDFEGFGDSRPGSGPDTGIVADVVAAAKQLRRHGADKIVLIGSSMGATAVLAAATRIRPPVAGVVSLSGPGAFGAVNAGGGNATPSGAGAVRVRRRRPAVPGRGKGDVPKGPGRRQAAADCALRPWLRHPGVPRAGTEGAGCHTKVHRRPDQTLSHLPRRLGGLPTRQVVIANGSHPPVELVTIAAMLERGWSSPAVPSACP